MSNSDSNSKKGGLGFIGTLQLIFIVLKLVDAIKWGWLWVLTPLWIPIAILILSLVIIKLLK